MGGIFDDAYSTGEVIEDIRELGFDRAMKYLAHGYGVVVIKIGERKFVQIKYQEGEFIDGRGKVYTIEEIKQMDFYRYTLIQC